MTDQQTSKLNLNHGLILGLILSLFTAYSYAIDNTMYYNYWMLGLLLLTVPVFGLIAIISTRKSQGHISFKDALKNYTLTITLGLLISTFTSILIFNIVDTNFYKVVQKIQVDGIEKQKDRTIQQMYNGNPSESQIEDVEKSFDDAMDKMKDPEQYSVVNQLLNFIKSVGAYLIFGLILAAILRKQDPELI